MRKIKMNLDGLYENAYDLLPLFKEEAIKQGYNYKQINDIIDEGLRGGHNNMVCILKEYTIDNRTNL